MSFFLLPVIFLWFLAIFQKDMFMKWKLRLVLKIVLKQDIKDYYAINATFIFATLWSRTVAVAVLLHFVQTTGIGQHQTNGQSLITEASGTDWGQGERGTSFRAITFSHIETRQRLSIFARFVTSEVSFPFCHKVVLWLPRSHPPRMIMGDRDMLEDFM